MLPLSRDPKPLPQGMVLAFYLALVGKIERKEEVVGIGRPFYARKSLIPEVVKVARSWNAHSAVS